VRGKDIFRKKYISVFLLVAIASGVVFFLLDDDTSASIPSCDDRLSAIFEMLIPPPPGPKLCVLRELTNRNSKGVTWSGDGSKLATLGGYGTVLSIWSADGTRIQQTSRPQGYHPNSGLGFVNGDTQLVTPPVSIRADTIAFAVVDVASGKVVREVPGLYPDRGNIDNKIVNLALTPDRSVMAVEFGMAGQSPIALYSTRTWERLRILHEDVMKQAVRTLLTPENPIFSPDGRLLALGTIDGAVYIYDWKQGNILRKIDGFATGSHPVFSPDGAYIAVATESNNPTVQREGGGLVSFPREQAVRVYRLSDGEMVAAYPTALPPINDVAWSPDGRFLALIIGSRSGKLRLWEPFAPDHPPQVFNTRPATTSLAFSPDGQTLAIDNTIGVTLLSIR